MTAFTFGWHSPEYAGMLTGVTIYSTSASKHTGTYTEEEDV